MAKKLRKGIWSLRVRQARVRQIVGEIKTDLRPFSNHLFNASWQVKEFDHLKKNIPENWMIICQDFAENYTCRHEDAAQSAHWHYEHVTLHPSVVYYRCETCDEPMKESIIFISEDHKHDYHAVQHFVVKAT